MSSCKIKVFEESSHENSKKGNHEVKSSPLITGESLLSPLSLSSVSLSPLSSVSHLSHLSPQGFFSS